MLSKEQQDIIENSIWVVNTALKRQNLSHNEDLRQSAILYMCDCLTRFDGSKNIKWTTFAYKSVSLYIKRTMAKTLKRQQIECGCDIDNVGGNLLGQNDLLRDVLKVCTDKEKKTLYLKMQGFKKREIAERLSCSVSCVGKRLRTIRIKTKGEKQC